MAEEYYDYDEEMLPRKKDNLFLWTILILILIGVAFACWLGSFYVFGHPEEARSYAILKKLKKIEAPRRFDVTAAPQGKFLTAQEAFAKFSTLTPLDLERENAELLRIYIKNYTETKKLVPYLRGKFDVIQAEELQPSDLFPMGTVALMQASDYAQVVVEHVFPATGPNLAASKRLLVPGHPFNIQKTYDVTAIVHVERLADGRMLLTAVPLHYPSYAVTIGSGTFASEPPLDLNVAAGLPISRVDKLNEALKNFAQLRANEPISGETKIEPKGPELVRVDTVPIGTTAPQTGAIPEPPVAAAQPVRPVMATPRPRFAMEPTTGLRATPMPQPIATPLPIGKKPTAPTAVAVAPSVPVPPSVPAMTPRPVATPPLIAMAPRNTAPPVEPPAPPSVAPEPAAPPAPTMPAPAPVTSPTGVPLKPFVQSNQGVAPPPEVSGTWRLYQPGTQPRGRTISSTEAVGLADQGTSGERLYLSGNFRVSARGDNKAVLRPNGEAMPPNSEVRIVVEFPNGAQPPDEGEVFARDATRPFEVRAITRADDGRTVNVFVREVTR